MEYLRKLTRIKSLDEYYIYRFSYLFVIRSSSKNVVDKIQYYVIAMKSYSMECNLQPRYVWSTTIYNH